MKHASNFFGILAFIFFTIMLTALFTTPNNATVTVMLMSLIFATFCTIMFIYCDKQAQTK